MLFEAGDVTQQSNYAKDLNLALDKLKKLTAWLSQRHNHSE
jgi:hypothetical protein